MTPAGRLPHRRPGGPEQQVPGAVRHRAIRLGVTRPAPSTSTSCWSTCCCPWSGFLAARLFRLTPLAGRGGGGLWVLLWFFDSFLHWIWFCGMISWGAAGYLIVLLVACSTAPSAPEERAAPGSGSPSASGPSLLALLHPFASLTLVAALPGALPAGPAATAAGCTTLALVLRCARRWRRRLIWLVPALQSDPLPDRRDLPPPHPALPALRLPRSDDRRSADRPAGAHHAAHACLRGAARSASVALAQAG